MPDSSSAKVLRNDSAGSRTWRTCVEPNPRSDVSGGAHAATAMTRTATPVPLTSRVVTGRSMPQRRHVVGDRLRPPSGYSGVLERAVDAERGQDQPQVGGHRPGRRGGVLDQLAV